MSLAHVIDLKAGTKIIQINFKKFKSYLFLDALTVKTGYAYKTTLLAVMLI